MRCSLYRVCLCSVLLFEQMTVFAQAPVDPWRNVNESIFAFNDFFDRRLVRPVASTYITLVPRVARQSIGSFFGNLNDINVFVNDLLQLKFNNAFSDCGRFLINTTMGVAGVIDVASKIGLEKNREDFGQTLGYWGVGGDPMSCCPCSGPVT